MSAYPSYQNNEIIFSCLTKDEKEIKREKRKQSNRESARRSRLRKQVLFVGNEDSRTILIEISQNI